MKGLTKHTAGIFSPISSLPCIKGYLLVGGTALSLQINNRNSEDLDFCKWSTNIQRDKPRVDWPAIEKELERIGVISSRNVLGFDQVNFVVDGVRLSFLTRQTNLSPVSAPVVILNNISAADLKAIAAMKIELMLRRSEFRDYYDIYSLLMEGESLKDMVEAASAYSNYRLKTRDALNFLSNGNNYKKDKSFDLLEPFYDIDHKGIEEYIRSVVLEEYGD